MLSPKKTAGMVLATILVASTILSSTAFANQGVPSSIIDLESEFAGFEEFLNDLSNEVNQNMIDIVNLQGNVTANIQHLLDHHDLIDVNVADISTNTQTLLDQLAVVNNNIADILAAESRLTTVEVSPTSILAFGSFNKNGLAINNDDVFLGFNNICLSSDTRCFFLSQRIIPMAGTISNIIVRIDGSTTNDYKFTVYKNGIQTSLTCTITASGSTECNDMINSFTVQAGDTINLANSFISVAGGSDDRLVQACISLNP